MCQTAKKERKAPQWRPFFRILKKNVPWLWYLANLIVGFFYVYIVVELPQLTGQLMDGEIFDSAIVAKYTVLSLVYLFLSVAVGVSGRWADLFTERKIQHNLWKKMIRLPMRVVDQQNPSTLISRLTTDTTKLTAALSYMISLILETVTLVSILLEVFSASASIGLSILLVIPYILVITIVPGQLYYKVQAKMQETLAKFTDYVTERLMSIRLIKASAAESADIMTGYAVAEENFRAEIKLAVVDLCTQPFTYSTEGIIGAIILIMGSILVNKGEMGMDQLITMYLYSSTIFTSLLQYLFCYYEVKKAQGATGKISQILDTESEEMKREISFTEPDMDISFDHVSFAYGKDMALSDVSLTIPTGKVTAIVGPSGAGKSTVLSLVERLYTPDQGSIRFGDTPVEKIHLDEWRISTGYIQQNSPLISGSIRDNVTYGMDRPVSNEEVEQALRSANAYDFVQELPDGVDSDIGQLGGKLSGGERQRIAIARMLIKNPDYLLLDEPTSSLDADNESAVQDALTHVMSNRTVIVVAHRLRTIRNADQIIVMDGGQVKAVGTHAQLYAGNDIYHRYYDLQQENAD